MINFTAFGTASKTLTALTLLGLVATVLKVVFLGGSGAVPQANDLVGTHLGASSSIINW